MSDRSKAEAKANQLNEKIRNGESLDSEEEFYYEIIEEEFPDIFLEPYGNQDDKELFTVLALDPETGIGIIAEFKIDEEDGKEEDYDFPLPYFGDDAEA
jgi:hypothetical protein